MKKEIIHTDAAPRAVGPYSQAVKIGDFLFTSGQIALDPDTMQLVEGDVQIQTHQVLKNLDAVLQAGDSTLENVVKTTVFLADIADYKAVNAVYEVYFSDSKPARSAVAVRDLPLGALVEIEAVAFVKKQKEVDVLEAFREVELDVSPVAPIR
jgi:2-iminobutanoate/2-iminopropanoate deaminase